MRLTRPRAAWCDARAPPPGGGPDLDRGAITMSTTTLTMAGLLAPAGDARLVGVRSLGCASAASLAASYGVQAHQAPGSHQTSTWTKGAIAKPGTFMVFDGKNRPSRPSRS